MSSTEFAPGEPLWLDIGARDIDAQVTFYRAVFGWDFVSAGPEAGGYGMFQKDGETVAAIGPQMSPEERPAWVIYFHTPDADATAKLVEQGGGQVRMAPDDVFDMGRMAQFTGPEGAQFAVWQPGALKGLDSLRTENDFLWAELHTTEGDRSAAFYRSVFSWDISARPTEGLDAPETYSTLARQGASAESAFGGMMRHAKGELPGDASYWVPYFGVTDCDATVAKIEGNGGSVLLPPMTMPGVGRMAAVFDPEGAMFSLLTPDPQM